MKRFYKEVAVAGVDETDGFTILLDDRPVRTPARRRLEVPTEPLASRIAGEWQGQGEKIVLDAMPFTRLAATAVDRVIDQRQAYIDEIARFAQTDLVCYRAPAPVDLAERQARSWQPLVEWVEATYSARLAVTEGIAPLEQERESFDRLVDAVGEHDEHALAALGLATVATGSLVIALALAKGELDPDQAYEASQLDETWQAEQWGRDPEADRRRDAMRQDVAVAHEYLVLLGTR